MPVTSIVPLPTLTLLNLTSYSMRSPTANGTGMRAPLCAGADVPTHSAASTGRYNRRAENRIMRARL